MEDVELNNNKKINPLLIIFTIILGLGIALGAIYYMYYRKDSRKNELSSGLVSIQFTEGSGVINLQNEVPVIDDVGLEKTPYTFTVKNTSIIPIDVKIKLDINNLTTSIDKSAVKYGLFIDNKLVKKDNIDPNNLILYTYEDMPVNKTINCKLVLWIDYYYETPNKTFNAKIVVEGVSRDVIETAATKIINRYNGEGQDGLYAVNTDGDLYNENADPEQTIREYRYSGANPNNYIYFNGNELWRIVGVFNGELKIVKDTGISNVPANYTHTDPNTSETTEFALKVDEHAWGSRVYFYNKLTGGNKNDWSTAGLQYYLNDTNNANSYWSSLKQTYIDLIKTNATYYLGNVTFNNESYSIDGTNNEVFVQERGTTVCNSNVSSDSHFNDCNIWNENQLNWEGAIGLLYPSDYGYANDKDLWEYNLNDYSERDFKHNNWMLEPVADVGYFWFISPSSKNLFRVMNWWYNGKVESAVIDASYAGVRPTLYLKSNTKIISGTGTSEDPYRLIAAN